MRLFSMKNAFVFFFLLCCLLSNSQIKDLSIYYSTIPNSDSYFLDKLQSFNTQITFRSKNKFNFGAFVFCAINRVDGHGKWVFNSQVTYPDIPGNVTLGYSFNGTQIGLGLVMYYRVIKTKNDKFILSLGIKPSLSFFTGARCTYSSIYVNRFGETDTIATIHTTNNYEHLKDPKPDVFLINSLIRFEFTIFRNIKVFAEPFILLPGVRRYHHELQNAGLNTGLTWTIKEKNQK